ncbi:MAG: S-layer y protein, partial [Bacillota bacterium]|nr:S-layer y protein [Bacillota bacterium]
MKGDKKMSIKKLSAIILSLVMATGSLGLAYADTQQTPATAKDYTGHWAESTIQKWVDEGKIKGYSDGSFKPDNKITRAEFVQLVNNSLVDYTSQTATPFADVKSGEWYEKA